MLLTFVKMNNTPAPPLAGPYRKELNLMTWFEEFCDYMKARAFYEINRLSDIVVMLIFSENYDSIDTESPDILFSDAVNEYVRDWQLQLF